VHVIAARALKCEADRAGPNDKNFRVHTCHIVATCWAAKPLNDRPTRTFDDLDPGTITGESQLLSFPLDRTAHRGHLLSRAPTGLRYLLHCEEKVAVSI
jgi:hypothetical protein